MSDAARAVAFDPRAPADERYDAQSELQQSTMPRALSDLLPRPEIQPVIDHILRDIEDQEIAKALQKPNIIPFPSKAIQEHKPGMQSVYLDDMQIAVNGDWFEKPSMFGFDSMRMMVEQTPVLNAVIMTRTRQVQRFCRIQETGKGPGFEIRIKERDKTLSSEEKQSIQLLQAFMTHCGWESNPRKRMRLKRDDFPSFMAKLTRETLILDSMPIETEWKRDKELGLDGMYAVDGSTIRLCNEDGYRGDDEIYALQVVNGQIRAAYTIDDLIYRPRNPRANVLVGGYGLSETELLVRVVTGFLNAFTYNTKFFDSNTIPKGMLHLTGNYDQNDIQAFKRYWNAMVKGINNAWSLPVMVSKDQESKAAFERFGVEVNEIMFAKWMTFLMSIICAIYGMAPDEVNFESFTNGASSLSGSDTMEKIENSKDKGLRPLLAYFENVFSDYVIGEFSDKYVFRWTGLDEEDEDKRHEMRKLVLTVNEIRAQEGYDKLDGPLGEAPVNPALLNAWQAQQQQGSQDFGQPGAGGEEGAEQGGEQDQGGAEDQGGAPDFGSEQQQGQPPQETSEPGDAANPDFGTADDAGSDQDDAADEDDDEDMSKAFGLPVFQIEV